MSLEDTVLQIVDVSSKQDSDFTIGKKLLEAAKTQGFLFIDGHDFTQDEVDKLFGLSHKFFKETSIEEKSKYPIDSNDCGYTQFHQEMLDPETQKQGDPKEAFNFGNFELDKGINHNTSLPEIFKLKENEKLLQIAANKFYLLSMRVMTLLAIGLEIDENKGGKDWFVNRHRPNEESITAMRFIHYPPCNSMDESTDVRAGAHTDYGTVTLLLQKLGEQGLELLTDGLKNKWTPIPFVSSPNPEYLKSGMAAPIIFNIADMLSYWTGGLLKSTLHRVVLPKIRNNSRYSTVFFLNSENKTLLEPIPSNLLKDIKKGANIEIKVKTAKEYLDERFAATYVEGH
ncbi:oxidoreductase activity protein [[Candida] boidinii]|nr:oxidoreductase activity protein [[Candida] boidinii]